MALATATPDGVPSVRIVLLKGIDDAACVLHELRGRKGRELAANPRAALTLLLAAAPARGAAEGAVERLDERGIGRLLRHPAARRAARRLGVGAGHA